MNEQKDQNLSELRHSTAHLLAAAIMQLYPEAKRTIGPSIENGFYYDFDNLKISEADFPKIEKVMHKLATTWKSFDRNELSVDDVKKEFKDNEYKIELIEQFSAEDQKLTVYQSGDFRDLCRGGHVEHPNEELKFFKLLSVAGAYWRGDEKNKMLTRIYGTAFFTQEELDKYVWAHEEAKKRDHRKLGRELELFTFSDQVGQGLTLWLPNGATIRREIENFMVQEQIKMGYQHVYSPHIGQKSLWEKSGHWDLYREKMYSPMDVDGVEFLVKPMTCPMHIQSYEIHPRSYRELPYKIAEIASVYRYEQSGELSGLLRVRAFTQDDAHIFCTPEQATQQFLEVFRFIQRLYAAFGFTDYKVRLGIRSKKEKYLGNDEVWARAEEKIIEALKESGADYFISEGDAAFYGPKADFMIKDALGRQWQCGTVQIDFMLPERFGLKYVDSNNVEQTPVMVHRAPLGSIERFVGILIEHYAGAFPIWLAPTQVSLLPISEHELEYAKSVEKILKDEGIRVNVDESASTLGKKMVKAREWKVPYMAILGKQEVENKTVTVKNREGVQITLTLDELVAKLKQEVASKL